MRHHLSSRHVSLIAVLLILEYALSPAFSSLGGRPDFLYLAVLDYAFFWSWERVPVFAVATGLLRDCLGGHLFGIQTLSLAVTGWLLSLGMQKLERDSFSVRLGMTVLFVALAETCSVVLGASLETARGFVWSLTGSIFRTTLYTTILAPGFFWFADRWFKRTPILKQYELF